MGQLWHESGRAEVVRKEDPPLKFGWLYSHESYQPEGLVRQAALAEETGFDAVYGSDHFHPCVDDESAAGFVWGWLGAVAERTD